MFMQNQKYEALQLYGAILNRLTQKGLSSPHIDVHSKTPDIFSVYSFVWLVKSVALVLTLLMVMKESPETSRCCSIYSSSQVLKQ